MAVLTGTDNIVNKIMMCQQNLIACTKIYSVLCNYNLQCNGQRINVGLQRATTFQ